MLACELGMVEDISASGMRVKTKRRPPIKVGDKLALSLSTIDFMTHLHAEVVWITRRGWFSHEVGLRFVDVNEQTRAGLDQAVSVAVRRLLIADR